MCIFGLRTRCRMVYNVPMARELRHSRRQASDQGRMTEAMPGRADGSAGAPRRCWWSTTSRRPPAAWPSILREDGYHVDMVGIGRGGARALQGRHLPPVAHRSSAAREERRRADQAGARRRAGDGDRAHHRPRDRQDRGLGAQARRHRLHPQAGQSEEAARARQDAARRAARLSAQQAAGHRALGRGDLRGHDGALARHAQRVREDQAGGAVGRHGAHHRRVGHRQGAGGARHPHPLASAPPGRSSPCTPAPSRAS